MKFVHAAMSIVLTWILVFQLENVFAQFEGQLNRPEFPLVSSCQHQNVNLIFISDSESEHYATEVNLLAKIVDLFSSGQEKAEHMKVGMAVSASDSQNHSEISWLFKLGFYTKITEIKTAITQSKRQPHRSNSFSEKVVDFVKGFLHNSTASTFESSSIENKPNVPNLYNNHTDAALDVNIKKETGTHSTTIIVILANPSLLPNFGNKSFIEKVPKYIKLLMVLISSKRTKQKIITCRLFMQIPCVNLQVETMLFDQSVSLALCDRCFHGWFGPMPSSEMLKNSSAATIYDPVLVYQSCYTLERLIYPENYAFKAVQKCEEIGVSLVSIETKAEWDFLNNYLVGKCNSEKACPDNLFGVFIGLQRNTQSLGKRFRWINGRPLIYNRWFRNHPVGGYVHGCVVWDLNYAEWIDIGCGRWMNSTAALCEWSKQLNAEQVKPFIPSPPSDETINNAITRGPIAVCKSNDFQEAPLLVPSLLVLDVAACSMHVNNTGRLQVLDMPMKTYYTYPCNDDNSRPIQFSDVCDQHSNCENKRDETEEMCKAPGYQIIDGFTCKSSGRTLPLDTRCDLFTDCDDESDEENCETCQFGLCSDGSCVPQPWLTDEETDCVSLYGQQMHDFDNSINPVEDCTFLCNVSKCVPWSKLGDGVVDCLGPEGPLDETLGVFERSSCGNVRFNQWAPKCIYQKDRLGELFGCRNMRHLHDCQDFVCPEGYIKCPGSYCIPSHYLNNGEKDCLLGEDESSLLDVPVNIPGYFFCFSGSNVVSLHPDRLCDGSEDCLYELDERDCYVTCLAGFLCVSGFVVVDDYDRTQPLTDISFIDSRTRMIDFSGLNASLILANLCDLDLNFLLDLRLSKCSLTDLLIDSPCLPRLSKLDVSHNLLRNISMPSAKGWLMHCSVTNLRFLNMSYNVFLEHFDGFTLSGSKALRVLDLSHTAITTFPDMFAISLTLTHLNLSHTRITKLATLTFPKLHKPWYLDVLDLRFTHIRVVEPDAFKGLRVKSHLHSDFFKLCCPQFRGNGIPDHSCHAPRDPLSSCFNLLDSKLLTMLMWIMGTTAVLGNAGVILIRLIANRKTFRLPCAHFVTHLGVSDALMGVYLLIISSRTTLLEGDYSLHDLTWRESRLCQAAGALATLSTEASTSFILLLTIDRYFNIKLTDSQQCMRSRNVLICSILAWGLGLVLAAVPLVPWLNHWDVYSSNSVCLGLPLLPEKRPGWQFTTGVFIAYNGLLCLAIFFGQLMIYRLTSAALKLALDSDTFSQDENPSPKMAQNVNFTRRVAAIAATDLLARLLISVVGLSVLAGHELDHETFAWLTVFVMPINSALNPVLYSLPVLSRSLTRIVAKCMASRSKLKQRLHQESRL